MCVHTYIRTYICTYVHMYVDTEATSAPPKALSLGSHTVMSGCFLSGYYCYGDHLNPFLAPPVASN